MTQWDGVVKDGVIIEAMTSMTLAIYSLNYGEWNIPVQLIIVCEAYVMFAVPIVLGKVLYVYINFCNNNRVSECIFILIKDNYRLLKHEPAVN